MSINKANFIFLVLSLGGLFLGGMLTSWNATYAVAYLIGMAIGSLGTLIHATVVIEEIKKNLKNK